MTSLSRGGTLSFLLWLQDFVEVGELDPLNRRLAAQPMPDIIVQGTHVHVLMKEQMAVQVSNTLSQMITAEMLHTPELKQPATLNGYRNEAGVPGLVPVEWQ